MDDDGLTKKKVGRDVRCSSCLCDGEPLCVWPLPLLLQLVFIVLRGHEQVSQVDSKIVSPSMPVGSWLGIPWGSPGL